jgi:hypothetical protein
MRIAVRIYAFLSAGSLLPMSLSDLEALSLPCLLTAQKYLAGPDHALARAGHVKRAAAGSAASQV